MERQTIPIQIAGQTIKVVTTASEEEMNRLAQELSLRIASISQGRPISIQTLLLTSMALMHDLNEAKTLSVRLKEQMRSRFHQLLHRIDETLLHYPSLDGERGTDRFT